MYKEDDRLEEALSKAEVDGNSQASKSAGIPEAEQISSLVSLAASIRDLPHPEQRVDTARAEKRRILAAAGNKKQKQRSFGWSRNGGFTGQWMVLPAVAGAALLILMVFVLATGAGIYFSGPRGAQAATLALGSGVVEVLDTDGNGEWIAVSDGHRVKSGERLRTGADSQVTLTFFEGTQVTLDPNTDLVLSHIDGDWGKKLQVAMIQNEGETSHQVVPLRGADSAYHVMTPSGEATVKGTSFKVLVEETGNSVFSVETGEVLVSNDGVETFVSAGQSLMTELGVPLASASYQFTLRGPLGPKISKKSWSVAGASFTVNGGTMIEGDPKEGDFVEVNGRIKKKGEWVADSILTPDPPGDAGGNFTGVVTSATDDGLAINGLPFTVDDSQPDVAVGDLVRVTFTIDGQIWTVVTLEILHGVRVPDQDDDPDDDEILFFSPEESEITDCEPIVGSMREFTTSLIYSPEETGLQPLDVLLTMFDNRDELGESFVESITVSREGTVLDLTQPITLLSDGETIELVVTVTLGAGFDRLPPESKLEFQVVATEVVSDTVEGEPLSATFKVEWVCDEEVLFFSPEESEITDCEPVVGSMREFTTSLIYSPEDTGLQPLDVLLTMSDDRDELGEGFVESITISLEGTVLDLTQPITLLSDGETIELVVTVTLGAGFDRLPPESKLEIQVVATEVVTGTVDGVPLSAIFKIEWECDEEIPDLPDDDGDKCTREKQHPHALTLAAVYGERVGVDYDQIWTWFCEDNLGFGEIELAFKLFIEYGEALGLDVYDIIDMRLVGGLGWGQIKQELKQAERVLLVDEAPAKKVPPGKEKSEEAKNKDKPKKKDE